VVFEIHRCCTLHSPWGTRRYLKALPDLRICADFSHFAVVSEGNMRTSAFAVPDENGMTSIVDDPEKHRMMDVASSDRIIYMTASEIYIAPKLPMHEPVKVISGLSFMSHGEIVLFKNASMKEENSSPYVQNGDPHPTRQLIRKPEFPTSIFGI
jgi:hypothetical protein